MRDWESLVNGRMPGLRLSTEARTDVVRELASHFEDIYDDARERGASEEQAHDQALGSVRDWESLSRDLEHEKESFMTTTPFRRKVVWPGMIALVTACIPLFVTSVLFRMGNQHIFQVIDAGRYFVFNIPWLIALPVAGAVGAWLSWRNGGSTGNRASAALFPSFMYLVAILGALVLSAIIVTIITVFHIGPRPGDFRGATPMEWVVRMLMLLTPWVLAPALSCLIGSAPFLWLKPHPVHEQPSNEAHA